jgi:hypothetical protein
MLVAGLMTFCNAELALSGPPRLAQDDQDPVEVYTRTPNRGLNPEECEAYQVNCTCYAPDTLKKIYRASVDRDKCLAELYEKSQFIQERLVTWGAGQPVAFWQEPHFVVGSVVVSVGVGAALAAWALNR